MRKLKVVQLVLSLGVLLYVTALYAAEESFTITTYYPSPYGSYNELSANKIAVGTGTAVPTDDGVIHVGQGIIYNPRGNDPVLDWPDNYAAGTLAYSSMNNAFYYSDGADWQALGGGGGGVRIVKGSGLGTGILGIFRVDCGAGWMITRCGQGDDNLALFAREEAVDSFMAYQATNPACDWAAFGAQSYSLQLSPNEYGAIILECAKQ